MFHFNILLDVQLMKFCKKKLNFVAFILMLEGDFNLTTLDCWRLTLISVRIYYILDCMSS